MRRSEAWTAPGRLRRWLQVAALPLALAACTTPPPEAYVSRGSGSQAGGEPAGTDARNEACLVRPGRPLPADLPVRQVREVYCGGWTQPAARIIELNGPTTTAQLDALARGGLWRTWLDQRASCGAPQATTLAGGAPARLLACTRRAGGWPHMALVAAGPNGPVLADGVSTAAPVMERLALGRSGRDGHTARSEALELAVSRLSAEAFGTGDVGRYEELMSLGSALNQTENFAAAEEAYRAALAVQERILGRDDPNTVAAMMHLAINLSNQRRHEDAEALFARADAVAPRAADPVAPARLLHYRGLHALNIGKPDEALSLLQEAERAYAVHAPVGALSDGGAAAPLVADPVSQSALFGLAEARRNRALALVRAGRPQEASALVNEARQILRRAGLEANMTAGRALRTQARAAARTGRTESAARLLEQAAGRFAVAAPGERPEAVTLFLAGAQRLQTGRRTEALTAFRAGAGILRARQITLPVELVIPYLDALHAEALASPFSATALQTEMFGAAQLAQRGNTARFVQQATARLGAAAGDERVATAVRNLQDADRELRDLFAERDALATSSSELDERIAAAQDRRAEAESEVAAAAPGYRQLLLSAVEVEAVQAALGPDEALVTMLLGRQHGYVMAVRPGRVEVRRTSLGEVEAATLVRRVRASIEPASDGQIPAFDTDAAHALHRGLLQPVEPALEGVRTLAVAPDGMLLSLPFGLLLTGPAAPDALAQAPWLVRRFSIVHVPSPQTLTTLRAAGGGSSAPRPYIGFGDFVPPSAAQYARLFPADRCGNDAQLAQLLGRLPGTRAEVLAARQLMGTGADSVVLGPEFTAARLRSARLDQHRIVHLATHALLAGELSCLPEPAILMSAPPNAMDAAPAFLPASEILGIRMDADLVILSACNTGGADSSGGEALSGLARAFFYAGARGLLVTHWSVDDAAAALTVADALRRQQAGAASAGALRGAQLLILEEAGKRLPAAFAHPYYWAPFALIGDGRRMSATTAQAGDAATRSM